MSRVKRGVQSGKFHNKILNKTKGYYGSRSRVYRVAKQSWLKAGQYSYIGRKQKKRYFRSLWILRINSVVRYYGINYSLFMRYLRISNIFLNRKLLSDMAIFNRDIFFEIVRLIKEIY